MTIIATQIETSLQQKQPTELFNIASYLPRMASERSDQQAVIIPQSQKNVAQTNFESMTFAEMEAYSNRCANGLVHAGFEPGMRVLVMVKPGIEFVGLIFALFKMGAVPVMIDPGMGVNRLLDCIRMVDPQAFIGIPLAHIVRVLKPSAFKTVKKFVTVGRRWFWGGSTLKQLTKNASDTFDIANTRRTDTAAILFTSGSTGPAKGVVYEHGMFDAQVRMIQSCYDIQPGEIDLPAFPLFVLFSTAMGMTAVIPEMDPSHPVKVDPKKIVSAIHNHNVTSTFGSPAIWKKVAAHCVKNDIKLPSLRRILIAGAPVPFDVIHQFHQVLNPDADVYTPYGATESLPVSSVSGRELIGELSERSRKGAGTCVGKPFSGVDLQIIRITDDPITNWSDELLVPEGEFGEIIVSGPMVTREYYGLPHANSLAKITDGDRVWHRIGDIGYRDSENRIWFCGRKAHRVVTESGAMYSVCCEAIFNEHPDVQRSALVGIGPKNQQQPVIIIEPEPGRLQTGTRAASFIDEMLELAKTSRLTRPINKVFLREQLPVDIRHNAKINREELAIWATRQPV